MLLPMKAQGAGIVATGFSIVLACSSGAPTSSAPKPSSEADWPQGIACAEVFPNGPRTEDGGVPALRADGSALGAPPHRMPMVFDLGAVPVGSTVTGTVRFFDFCASESQVGSSTLEPVAGDIRLTVPAPGRFFPGAGVGDRVVDATFRPTRTGEHRVHLRTRTDQGFFDVTFVGEGIAP